MPFSDKVYDTVSRIPAGKVMSYSSVAFAAGFPGAARAVGTAMSRNPNPGTSKGKIPCHRVVSSDGSLGGFTSPEGPEKKQSMLEKEGIEFNKNKIGKRFFLTIRTTG